VGSHRCDTLYLRRVTDRGVHFAETHRRNLAASARESLPVEAQDESRLVAPAASARAERFPAGSTILHQGVDPAGSLYVIRSGHVEIRVSTAGSSIVANIAREYRGGRRPSREGNARATPSGERYGAEARQALKEAFRLLWQVRLEHQVRQVENGEIPDDFVDPAHLGPIARLGLKEAFRIIGREQQTLATELGVRLHR
jgi:signal-transduction protein with cAMP-binding, CBS, and nucleotidyltransferase domain